MADVVGVSPEHLRKSVTLRPSASLFATGAVPPGADSGVASPSRSRKATRRSRQDVAGGVSGAGAGAGVGAGAGAGAGAGGKPVKRPLLSALKDKLRRKRGLDGASASGADSSGKAAGRWDVPHGPPPDGTPFTDSELVFTYRWPQASTYHEVKREVLTLKPDGSLLLRTDRTFFMARRNGTSVSLETGYYAVDKPVRRLRAAWALRCCIQEVKETRSKLTTAGTTTAHKVHTKPLVFAASITEDLKSCVVNDGSGARTFTAKPRR